MSPSITAAMYARIVTGKKEGYQTAITPSNDENNAAVSVSTVNCGGFGYVGWTFYVWIFAYLFNCFAE
jgi:hypothetical protein